MNDVKVAAVQFCHANADKARNLDTIARFAADAAANHVDLVVFPEMCITGYWGLRNAPQDDLLKLAEKVPAGPSTETLLDLADKHAMTVCAGLIELVDDGQLYNTYVAAMPDGSVASHRKLHCFLNEAMSSGDAYTVFDLPDGTKAGILICYDNNIIENVRITALAGAEILLAPHQTGGCVTPSPLCMGAIDVELWENRDKDPDAVEREFRGPKGRQWLLKWLPARAHDNGLFLVFANGVGRDDNEVRTGNSMILDPYGNILAETSRPADDIVLAELDPSLLNNCTGRRWIATRRPTLYTPLTTTTGKEQDVKKVRFNGISK